MDTNRLNVMKTGVILLAAALVGLLVYGGVAVLRNDGNSPQEKESVPIVSAVPNEEEAGDGSEIPGPVELQRIPYPFEYGYGREEWKLYLYEAGEGSKTGGTDSGYLIRMYDENDTLLQEFPIDLEADELVFRFDRLFQAAGSQKDLEIFPAGAEETGAGGLLFPWDYAQDRFSEDPVEIPWYELYGGNAALNAYLVRDADRGVETERIYRINEDTRQPVELRRWTLTGQTAPNAAGYLEIWDCLEEVSLYDGPVGWNEQGELSNGKYYEGLFWRDLETFWSVWEDEEIQTVDVSWDGEDENYDHMTYQSREELLADFGFADMEPFYEYCDVFQNLVLELYFDERSGEGCGIYHRYHYNDELEKKVYSCGFAFHHVVRGEWDPPDTFSTLSMEGDTARADYVSDYQETYEYTEDGKLSFFEARGIIEDYQEEAEVESLLSMDYYYRDDGTLSFKAYVHHPILFGTWHQWADSYYDEMGRLIFENEYVTHGSFLIFYLYEGDDNYPSYCLFLDDYVGDIIPEMIVYR